MKLIIGLGNPDKKYERNRHNIGFLAVDQIAEDYDFPDFQNKFSAHYSEGFIGTEKIKLLKPQTYMNKSGHAVQKCSQFFKIEPNEILVIHDELDLSFGKMRCKIGGGAGGHNGLKSIDQHIGKEFYRLRYGIDHPGQKSMVTSYVLGDFDKDEMPLIEELNESISDNIDLAINDQYEKFMTKIAMESKNILPQPDKPEIEAKSTSNKSNEV